MDNYIVSLFPNINANPFAICIFGRYKCRSTPAEWIENDISFI